MVPASSDVTTETDNSTVSQVVGSDVARALLRIHRTALLKTGLLRLTNTLLQVAPPLLVSRLLKVLEAVTSAGSPATAGALTSSHWAALRTSAYLFAALNLKTLVENQYFHGVSMMGLHVREALSTAVYNKTTSLSLGARQVGLGLVPSERAANGIRPRF